MAQATTTAPGTIVLTGDLGGSAYSPQLSPTGVNVTTNLSMYRKMYIDSKGRVVWISPDQMDLPVIGLTSTTEYGKMTVGENLEVVNGVLNVVLPKATEDQIGILKPGHGLDINSGGLTSTNYDEFFSATENSLGFIKVGTDLDINAGVLSFDYMTTPIASESISGITKVYSVPLVDDILSVSSGVLSAHYQFIPNATTTTRGIVKTTSANNIITATSGVLNYNLNNYASASTTVKGLVTIGSGFNYDGETLSFDYTTLPDATTTVKGLVQLETPTILPASGSHTWVYDGAVIIEDGNGNISINTMKQVNLLYDPYDRENFSFYVNDPGNTGVLQSGLMTLGPSFTTNNGVLTLNLDGGPIQARKYNGETLPSPSYIGSYRGVVKIGSGLSINAGVLSVDYNSALATTSSKGFVQVGSGLSVNSGIISYTYSNMPDATTNSTGAIQVGSGLLVDGSGILSLDESLIPVYSDATTSTRGVVQIGNGLKITSGLLDVDTSHSNYYGSDTTLGFVKIGDNNLSVDGSGYMSAYYSDITPATTTSKGAVKIGSGLSVVNGVLSLPIASETQKGFVELHPTGGIVVNSGVISVDFTRTASLSQYGIVKIGTTETSIRSALNYVDNKISLPIASDTVFGIASLGYGLEKPNPLFTTVQVNTTEALASIQDATTTSKGIMQVGAGLTISGGTLSIDTATFPTATSSVKGFVQVGSGFSMTSGVLAPNGTFSSLIPIASETKAGLVKGRPDTSTYFYMNGEFLTFDPSGLGSNINNFANATTSLKGVMQVGTGLLVSGGTISLDPSYVFANATPSAKGVVQIGDGLSVDGSGVISANIATSSTNGLIRVGRGLSVSSGVLTMDSNIFLRVADTNYLTSGIISYSSSTLTPTEINTATWTTAADHTEEIFIDLTSDITSFPSTKSPITNITYYNSGGFTISGFAANYKFNQVFSTAPIGEYGSFTIVNDGTNCFVIQ